MDSLICNAWGILNCRYFGYPFFVKFEITHRCNNKCNMCNRWMRASDKEELSLAKIKAVAENIKKLKVTDISITGGEVFLRDDILDILKIFKDLGMRTRLQTNGGPHVTPELLDKVISLGVKSIGVSLHTLDTHQLNTITGKKDVMSNAIRTIEYLSKRIPWPIVNIVVTKMNIEEVPEIIMFADRLGAYSHTIPISMPEKSCENKKISDYLKKASFEGINPEVVDRVYNKLILMKKQGYRILHSSRYLEDCRRFIKDGNKKFNCYAGESFFVVLPDGTFRPCEMLELTHDATSPDLISFLKSEEYSKKLKDLRKRCAGCECGNYHEYSYIMEDNKVLVEGAIKQLLFKIKG